jgi:hypothetical protein
MPINPQIVMPQVQGLQLENPLNMAKNVLAIQQAQSEIAANELATARANKLQGLIAGAGKPGGPQLTPQALMAAGFFKEAGDLASAQSAATTGQEKSFDVLGKAMDTSARLLDTVRTPDEFIAWHEANHADPIIGKYLTSRGVTADQSRAKIMDAAKDPAAFQQLLLDARLGLQKSREQHFVEQNYGGGTRVLAMGKFGGPSRVVPGSDIAVTRSPNAPVTNINMPSKKFGETIGEKAATRLDTFREGAEQAARGVATNARLRPLLEDKNFISGTLADARLALAKAVGIDVSATESFISGMAEQVAARIKAFGTGTGLSNADRDYALAWAGGKPDLTAKGIARIMRINDASADEVMRTYNKEREFLAKTEPAVLNYYPAVGARGVEVGTVKQGYRFKGGDPANEANWEKVK